MPQRRYDQLLELVAQAKPETIIEIGVWNGARACKMAETALRYRKAVHYSGYDLFEEANDATDRDEFNKKPHNSMERVRQRLIEFKASHPGFTFELHRGNTRDTLAGADLVADFAYVDGGHSVDTIRSDYHAVRNSRVVVFDDYYQPAANGTCVDLDLYGANRIVDAIPGAEIIESGDTVAGGGHIALAVVRRRQSVEAA